jgi:hypothetical protein
MPQSFRKASLLAFVAALLVSCGCALFPRTETPAQAAYAALAAYETVVAAAADYAESPVARPEIVRALGQNVQQGQMIRVELKRILALPDSLGRDTDLRDLTRILNLLRSALRSQLIAAGEGR